jgi:nucleoid-associated protein YgaU
MAKSNKTWLEKFKESESSTSVVFGAIVVVVVGILLFNYSRSNPSISNDGEATESASVMSPTGIQLPTTHTVVQGETLWAIAERYYGDGEKWSDLVRENGMADNGMVEIGQVISVPVLAGTEAVAEAAEPAEEAIKLEPTSEQPTVVKEADDYTVVAGDSLWNIALATYNDGYRWGDIYNANKNLITDPDMIYPGQVLVLP